MNPHSQADRTAVRARAVCDLEPKIVRAHRFSDAVRRAFIVRPKRISETVDEIVSQLTSRSSLSLCGPTVRDVHEEIERAIEQA